jgi:hypothetical protein
MQIVRIVAVVTAVGLLASVAGMAMAQGDEAAPPLNWNDISWQIRSLPTINALNFTATQLEQVIPVLKQINKEFEQAGRTPPVDNRAATQIRQLREGLLQGHLKQEDIDNARQALAQLEQKDQEVFDGLPAVKQLKGLLSDEQKGLLEGATILSSGLRHRPPIPAPPFMQPGVNVGRVRAEKVLENIRQMPDAEYDQKRTEWATRLVERTVPRDDPKFAQSVAALAAIFDGVRKLSNEQFEAQREDLVTQVLPYTGGTETMTPPPPPPPPAFGGGQPNLRVLVDPRVISLLEAKLTYLRAAAEG